MTAIATLPVLLATGIHSARPAASAVGSGGLYSCTTHSLVYQTNGSSWTTWADLAGTGIVNPMTTQDDIIVGGSSGTPGRLAKGSDGQVLTVNASTHHLDWETPSTGFSDPMSTRGDVIIRNASNVTARLGIGSTGKVLSSDGTDISWQTPAGSPLLGVVTYSTGSDTAWASSSSATAVDIDATNASLAITIPASGKIIVMMDVMVSNEVAQDYVYLTVNTGGGPTVLATRLVSAAVGNGFGQASFATQSSTFSFYITGLTPGSLTIKAGMKSGGTGSVKVYANDGAGGSGHRNSPFVMSAWAA